MSTDRELLAAATSLIAELQRELAELKRAASQASFALRELLPNDPDAQMTVRMLDAARGEKKE